MSPRPSEQATLRRLVRDARAERPAEIDWSSIEERLLREVRRAPPPTRSGHSWAWAALAALAAATIWLVSARGPATKVERQALIEATESRPRDGDLMARGARVTTAEHAVSVAHARRATWTLAANSSAVLAGKGERITLQLERGGVLSEVVPSPKAETFVVEAAGVRVAVHGTVFQVQLEDGRVLVQVREGIVAVGPRGGVPVFFLKAPARGDFAADGRSGSVEGPTLGQREAERRTAPLRLARSRAPDSAPTGRIAVPSASAGLPSEPSINDIEAGIASVVEVAAACFSRHTKSGEGVEISVRTALSMKISGSGTVSDVQFQPPLARDVEECAAAGVSQLKFVPSERGADVTRVLELKR